MTKEELREMIETAVEQKLFEFLGDPDEGLPLRKSVSARLRKQQREVRQGKLGRPFQEVLRELGQK